MTGLPEPLQWGHALSSIVFSLHDFVTVTCDRFRVLLVVFVMYVAYDPAT